MRLQDKATRMTTQLLSLNMLMWLTMLVGLAAILCLAATAYLALTMVLIPVLAALLTGIGLLVVCLCMAVLIALLTRPANTAKTANAAPSNASARTTSQASSGTGPTPAHDASHGARQARAADNQEMQWLEDNYGIALTATVAAGIVFAANPRLRRFAVRTTGRAMTRMASRTLRQFLD